MEPGRWRGRWAIMWNGEEGEAAGWVGKGLVQNACKVFTLVGTVEIIQINCDRNPSGLSNTLDFWKYSFWSPKHSYRNSAEIVKVHFNIVVSRFSVPPVLTKVPIPRTDSKKSIHRYQYRIKLVTIATSIFRLNKGIFSALTWISIIDDPDFWHQDYRRSTVYKSDKSPVQYLCSTL